LNENLFIGAFILQAAGVAPLLSVAVALLGMVASAAPGLPFTSAIHFRLLTIVITVGFVLAVLGGVDAGDNSASKQKTGTHFRKIGAIVLAVAFIVICALQLLLWTAAARLRKNAISMYSLLLGITFAMPFLFIRVLYTVLSSFSALDFASLGSGATVQKTGLAKFNSITGEWQIWLVMSVLMEFIVALIYLSFGLRLARGANADLAPVQEYETRPMVAPDSSRRRPYEQGYSYKSSSGTV